MGYATPSKKGLLIMSKHKIDYLVEKHLIKDTVEKFLSDCARYLLGEGRNG